MTDEPRNPNVRRNSNAEQTAALAYLDAVAKHAGTERTPEAWGEVHRAVEAARAAGVGWTRIGNTLGIASGNAYQRYRKRSSDAVAEHDDDATRCSGR
jgi:hypothetical protein